MSNCEHEWSRRPELDDGHTLYYECDECGAFGSGDFDSDDVTEEDEQEDEQYERFIEDDYEFAARERALHAGVWSQGFDGLYMPRGESYGG